jgi:hypothetical protein
MQNLTNFPSLIDRWLRYKFQTILVVCFLIWTPLLVIETLQIQHSCHPMIYWSGTLPAECQPKLLQFNSSSSKKPETRRDRSQEQKQIAKSDRSSSPKPSSIPQPQTPDESLPPQPTEKRNPIENLINEAKEHPDITGGVIAIGVAGSVAVVAAVPLAVAVGIGAVVWFAIRTML